MPSPSESTLALSASPQFPHKLLTTSDLADLFRTTPSQIQWLARQGRIPFRNVSLKRRGMLFYADDVYAWIADGKALSQPQPRRGRPLGSKNKSTQPPQHSAN